LDLGDKVLLFLEPNRFAKFIDLTYRKSAYAKKYRNTSQLITEMRMKISQSFQFLCRLSIETMVSFASVALGILPPNIHCGDDGEETYRASCP
jgi:hypothetical protein